ncbi:MAG: hypothetical protein U0V02_04575 [Anaerolineales bacterium]
MHKKLIIFCAFALLIMSAFPPKIVYADVAPPEMPPGTNLLPGNEATQVRMVAETVTLDISKDPADSQESIAKTEAVFTMRNLGTVEENMQVRFPLSFFNGSSDGRGNFPEIPSVAVKVDGRSIQTKRENLPFYNSEFSSYQREELPWAVFDVSFPPDQDIIIEVAYTVNGYGYYPNQEFKYILETGAGWKGTIGSADIIVKMPYEASAKNIWVSSESKYGQMSGNEIRLHFDEMEPTSENNIHIVVTAPALWETVLREIDNVTKNPNDGESWGRLGKAYKEVIKMPKGYLGEGSASREMFELSKEAYEKCLSLLPNDPLWHYGYADLLWPHFYFELYRTQPDVNGILPTVLKELQIVLALDPNNQQAKDLLTEISYAMPDVVRIEGDTFVFLGLTATPIPPTPFSVVETPTIVPTVTSPPPTYAMGVNTPEPVSAPNPLCGSAFLLPALFGGIIVFTKRGSSF